MKLWERLLRLLSRKPGSHSFQFDQDVIDSLQVVATDEKRSPQEVASDLLSFALTQRLVVNRYISSWQNLSPREQEIAALVCLNYTNQEIAVLLHISPQTVKTHVRSVLDKFTLRRKADLRQALANWDFSSWQAQFRSKGT